MGVKITMVGANNNWGANNNSMVGADNNGGANNNGVQLTIQWWVQITMGVQITMVGANNNGGWGNNCQQESTTFSQTAAALHPLNKTLWIHQGHDDDER